jgi:putative flippase GtrA
VVNLSKSRRFGVFSLVGAGGFVIQMASLAVLTRVFGWHYGVATLVAIEFAIFNNFFAHSRWTWGDRRPPTRRQWMLRWVRYQMTKTAVAALNVGLTVAIVIATTAPVELANAVAVGACSVLGFVVSERFIFDERQT